MTLHTVLEEVGQLWIPERKCWRLNERHYGDLQDQVKSEVAEEVGEKQAKEWRRSYACQPPDMSCLVLEVLTDHLTIRDSATL